MIEATLERIAVSLESICKTLANGTATMTESKPPETRGRKPVTPKPEPEELDLGGEPVKQIDPNELLVVLRNHAAAKGQVATRELMIKHGANKEKTTVASIPMENYAALYKDAIAATAAK